MRRYSSLLFGRNRTFLPDVYDISAIRAPEEADLDLGEARRKHIRDQNKKELVNRKSLLKGGPLLQGILSSPQGYSEEKVKCHLAGKVPRGIQRHQEWRSSKLLL